MFDALLSLQSLSTVTAAATVSGTAFDSKVGIRRKPLWAKVIVTALGGTGPTIAPKIQHSADNTTWTDLAVADPVSLSAATGEMWIPIETDRRYIRHQTVFGGTVTSGIYQILVGITRPS